MPTARISNLLPLGLLWASLAAQEPAPKPAERLPEQKDQAAPPGGAREGREDEAGRRRSCCARKGRPSVFGAYVQGLMPLRDLREELDGRTGFGLGLRWIQDHGDWHASRTRLEWDTFAEGGSAGARTYAKNYLLSFDHLFKLNQGRSQTYLVAGLGGSRWYLERRAGGIQESQWTTKLAASAGAGLQFGERMDLEARYVASSINRTFDANTWQLSLGWRFR